MTDTTEKLKAMIDRLQPGEMLRFDTVGDGGCYARIVPGRGHEDDETLERLWIGEDDWNDTSPMIDGMVKRGELAETDYCSTWQKPA